MFANRHPPVNFVPREGKDWIPYFRSLNFLSKRTPSLCKYPFLYLDGNIGENKEKLCMYFAKMHVKQ
jgi:hypothetical protein